MRRALRLIVFLSLPFLSLIFRTGPAAAQQLLPPDLVGHWQGTAIQVNPNAEYPVTIELTGGDTDSVVGTIAYPTYGCSGDLSLQRVAADGAQSELVEQITTGLDICGRGGAITLAPQGDGTLFFTWTQPDDNGSSVTATLERVSERAPADTNGLDEPTGDQPSGQADETSEAPSGPVFVTSDPAECTVAARTPDSFPALVSEPDAAMLALSTAAQTPGLTIPDGVPADPMTTAAVVDTYREVFACGDGIGELGIYALWTDDALRQLQIQSPSGPPIPADVPSEFRVTDVRVLPDGRVVAAVEGRNHGSDLMLVQGLVWLDDRFLINETLDVLTLSEGADEPFIEPAEVTALPSGFVGHWEGSSAWNDLTLPVAMDLNVGSVGESVGAIEYALYGTAGPKCGGDMTLQSVTADESQIELVGTITDDLAVCLIDAAVNVSLQADGTFTYEWTHPALTVTGSGTLIRTPLAN